MPVETPAGSCVTQGPTQVQTCDGRHCLVWARRIARMPEESTRHRTQGIIVGTHRKTTVTVGEARASRDRPSHYTARPPRPSGGRRAPTGHSDACHLGAGAPVWAGVFNAGGQELWLLKLLVHLSATDSGSCACVRIGTSGRPDVVTSTCCRARIDEIRSPGTDRREHPLTPSPKSRWYQAQSALASMLQRCSAVPRQTSDGPRPTVFGRLCFALTASRAGRLDPFLTGRYDPTRPRQVHLKNFIIIITFIFSCWAFSPPSLYTDPGDAPRSQRRHTLQRLPPWGRLKPCSTRT